MKFCRHKREIAATMPDGRPALQCVSCFRVRPHPWNQSAVDRKRWSKRMRKARKGTLTFAREILDAGRK